MLEQDWKRKEYETWDEAFHGLAPVIRQQSVRVAAYTQVLFVQACENGFAADTDKGRQQISSKFADLAYKCGLYHQLGKALCRRNTRSGETTSPRKRWRFTASTPPTAGR